MDGSGNLYISDCCYNNRVRKVSSDGTVTTVAGNGTPGFSGDGGPAASAQLTYPNGLFVDRSGNLFIADGTRVREVSPAGMITTVAGGNGGPGSSGDGGPATKAQLTSARGVAVDSAGNLFIADLFESRVRIVSPSGIIATLAGTGTPGYSGDGGPSVNAQLAGPTSLTVDAAGNVYVTDTDSDDFETMNNAVRVLRPVKQSPLISAVVDAAS